MRIVLYAQAALETAGGMTPANATGQIILDNGDLPVSWADVISAREHLRSLVAEVLADLPA